MAHEHHHAEIEPEAMMEILDLDAEVLHAHLADVITWVHDLAADSRRILDVGAGTGAGALALAQRFAGADVIAVDMSAPLLARLTDKARALGVADRIRTVEADLDVAWPAIDTVDLVWASASLHHMAKPDRVLADIFATLRPGGLLAVAELGAFPRFLSDDVGRELEARAHATLAEGMADRLPHLGSDWGPRLTKAGFTIEGERTFTIDLKPPLPAATGRYAQVSLRRLRSGLDDRISADDQATLDSIIESVMHRDDLTVHATRTVWLARRP